MAVLHDWRWHYPSPAAGSFVLRSVLAPLDGSELAKAALPVARTLVQLTGATLHVVYFGEPSLGPRKTLEQLGLTPEQTRGSVLDQIAGPACQAILRLAEELPEPLIVISTQIQDQVVDESQTSTGEPKDGPEEEAKGVEDTLSGLAHQILRAAPERVVFVTPEPDRQPWQIRRVVLAHDGTPSADAAIAPTADLAHLAGAEVIALHVAEGGSVHPSEPGSLSAPRYIDQPHHEWPAWAGEFLDRMLALGGSAEAINFQVLVTGGQPGSEIAQFARDHHADLVILPWHGNWEEQPAGAVDVVIRRSGCPVLLHLNTKG